MNNTVLSAQPKTSWIDTALGDQNFQTNTGFFAFWYRHASPPDAPSGASFEQREHTRRGRIAAACMLFLCIILVFVALVALLGPNKQIITVVYTLYPIIGLCIVLNRRGYVNAVGILLTLGLVGGMCLTLFTTAAGPGLSANDKDILYLLVFANLFVAAILPINYIFPVAIVNICLSIYMLSFAHHTPAFDVTLTTSYFSILFRVLQIQVVMTGILWILVSNLKMAIKRADRAETLTRELHRLQHDVSEREAEKIAQTDLFEQYIQEIVNTYTRVANGDLSARIPADFNTPTFGQITATINMMLTRYERTKQDLTRQDRLKQVIESLMLKDQQLRVDINAGMQHQHFSQPGRY